MTDQLQNIDIASVLRQEGPIVSCVVLRATNEDSDKKPAATDESSNDRLVEELQIDTTPKKNSVEKVLGGPFTFIGQYEEEGIMLMARQGFEDEQAGLALNPHKLQPPFNETKIHGDILVLKVAECEDPLDEPASENEKPVSMASNDEFFLNYTKEEYLKFAARTDVVPPALPDDLEEEEEEEEECDDENNEDEGEWSGEDDEEEVSEEEAQGAMMNLLMANVLRRFQEENGRGPNTEELLMLKVTIAQKLGIPMETAEGEEEAEAEEEEEQKEAEEDKEADSSDPSSDDKDESEEGKKRRTDEADAENCEPVQKKVKFGTEETNEKAANAVLAH